MVYCIMITLILYLGEVIMDQYKSVLFWHLGTIAQFVLADIRSLARWIGSTGMPPPDQYMTGRLAHTHILKLIDEMATYKVPKAKSEEKAQ